MTATLRGLVVAWAIAALLVLAALLSGRGEEGPVDRALVPGFQPEAVTALAWSREGAPPIRISRDPASPTGWSWEAPRGAADARALDDALAALRGGRWHRRRPASAAGSPAGTLAITRGAASIALALGEPLAGTDQRWLVLGAEAYLVDGWLARALFPDPLSLRIRRPLAAISTAETLQLSPGGDLGRVTITGSPRRVSSPFPLLLDPIVAASIEQPLAELEVLELPRAPVAPHGQGIVADRTTVLDAGPCPGAPGRWAIDGTAGPGCVGGGAWENAKRAIWTLTQPPAQLVERRPAPLDPATITLADGAVLDLTGRPRVGDRDADHAAAAELLAALSSPGEPVPLPTAKPVAALTLTDRAHRSITLELHPPSLVVRRGEPVALRLGEGAFQLLLRPSSALRDPTPWREEPTTITALVLDGTTYTRGAALGEWSRTGPGRDDPAAVEQLAAALAAPLARPDPHAAALRHTVTLHIKPIGGALTQHTLQLGDPTAARCPALVDNARVSLPPEICTLVRALSP